uniref:FAM13A-like domain-containing protein n=1 Tax=Grammatophora oceanica TaxID=210454 RepID=A0A7S1VBR6_9STRA|mmetsp:Transcript_42266/g.62653  ORF Transcript_42266/g.62653 Transcript_42266/m.62653 type:complete len:1231 (+) Transcript_42266:198-3890(+)
MLMALNATGEASVNKQAAPVRMVTSTKTSSTTSKNISTTTIPTHRKRRSKGTIAGYGGNASEKVAEDPASPTNNSTNAPNNGATAAASAQSPSKTDVVVAPPKQPCHSARLALLCTHNALRMGARTQLALCPPGRARRLLQQALRTRSATGRKRSDSLEFHTLDELERMVGKAALAEYEDQEEDFLLNTNTFDVDSDEEASSGDDDSILALEDLISDHAAVLDNEAKYAGIREPLFTPVGQDNANAPPGGGLSSASGGKLPFNHRKMLFFDTVSATERTRARKYLSQQLQSASKQDGQRLVNHLKRMQRREKRRLQLERGEVPDPVVGDDPMDMQSTVTRFPEPMSSTMAAALLLETLSMNPLESLEGMSKCYDGIVAAGVALLEASEPARATPMSAPTEDEDKKTRPSRSEIMAALAPLLITSLEQGSGEVIVQLAKMRRMCGTLRYQRRFVQRVAPALIRPPRAAIWCLRHQNDMEPILAAAELIFDSATDVFSKGWYDRGQQLLRDSVRKETLNTAAQQLRNLSSDPDSSGWSLNSRRNKFVKVQSKVDVRSGGEPLAEWEVIAVDRQIRAAISSIVSQTWSKVGSKDSDERSISSRSRRTTSSLASIGRRGSDASPKTTPRSPARSVASSKAPSPTTTSPKPVPSPVSTTAAPSDVDAIFGPSFVSMHPSSVVPTTTLSPDAASTASTPLSPPNAGRSEASKTPPRSPPTSPTPKLNAVDVPAAPGKSPGASTPTAAKSPKKDVPKSPTSNIHREMTPPGVSKSPSSAVDRAPLSPSGVSVSSEPTVSQNRVSSSASVSSVTSTGSQPAHYRMLTSTATERKRTVAACRALRSQIQRFEDAFAQLHGRPPKGAAERAPLATTYAQYREWKRAIRADAACRIQALFRGARTRWMLLRSGNPEMIRVVKKAPLRRQKPASSDRPDLLIPIDPSSVGAVGLSPLPSGLQTPTASGLGDSSPADVFGSSATSGTPPFSSAPRRLSGSSDLSASPTPPYATSSPTSPQDIHAELAAMSLPELQARKRDLKQQLKQYDMNFARQHGRMPVKAEKEPIRHLYEQYNALKGQISQREQEGSSSSTMQQPIVPRPSRTSSSSSLGSVSTSNLSIPDSNTDTESDSPGGHGMVRPKRKPRGPAAPSSLDTVPSTPPPPSNTPLPNDLAVLKTEKQRLHQMLRRYEKDFYKEHSRNVSSFADIKPVASAYRRYKEIKKKIASLQGSGSSSRGGDSEN